jgi:hypothetical protein
MKITIIEITKLICNCVEKIPEKKAPNPKKAACAIVT